MGCGCHQFLPPTRAEVSSEPTTGLARTASALGAAAASSGASARARMLAIAPHLLCDATYAIDEGNEGFALAFASC
jgi:hypothetical protein